MTPLDTLVQLAEDHLTEKNSVLLGVAKPPYASGVYALFYEGHRVYVGVAQGNKGLRNRKRNYVGGDEKHTTHREFMSKYANKAERTVHIKENVSMAWFETDTAEIAGDLERQLIGQLQPKWNRLGIIKT